MIEERQRLAVALRRYFEQGPDTFRTLLEFLEIDYAIAQREGWLDFNNAVCQWEDRIRLAAKTGMSPDSEPSEDANVSSIMRKETG